MTARQYVKINLLDLIRFWHKI